MQYPDPMAPKKLPSPYRPDTDYVLRQNPRLEQLARFFQDAADAQRAAADAATEPDVEGDELAAARARITKVLRRLNVAAAHAEVARRLAIEFALESELLTQRDVADAIGTSKKAVYDRRHSPVTIPEVLALPPVEGSASSPK